MDELQIMLEEYRKSFIQKLNERFNQIKIIEEKLYNNSKNADLFSEFYQIIHSISGSSGMAGLTQLSEISQELEAYLNEIIKSKLTINIDLEKISLFITKLKNIYYESKES